MPDETDNSSPVESETHCDRNDDEVCSGGCVPSSEDQPIDCQTEAGEAPQPSQTETTLESAVLAIADVCDGATSHDGLGFNRRDAVFFAPLIESIRAGNSISPIFAFLTLG